MIYQLKVLMNGKTKTQRCSQGQCCSPIILKMGALIFQENTTLCQARSQDFSQEGEPKFQEGAQPVFIHNVHITAVRLDFSQGGTPLHAGYGPACSLLPLFNQ